MSYTKSKIKLKISAFIAVIAILLWFIPTNLIYGDSIEDLEKVYKEAGLALEAAQADVDNANAALESAKAVLDGALTGLESAESALNLANELNLGYLETSARVGKNIDKVFVDLVDNLISKGKIEL